MAKSFKFTHEGDPSRCSYSESHLIKLSLVCDSFLLKGTWRLFQCEYRYSVNFSSQVERPVGKPSPAWRKNSMISRNEFLQMTFVYHATIWRGPGLEHNHFHSEQSPGHLRRSRCRSRKGPKLFWIMILFSCSFLLYFGGYMRMFAVPVFQHQLAKQKFWAGNRGLLFKSIPGKLRSLPMRFGPDETGRDIYIWKN